MKYRNTITGVEIDFKCKVKSNIWKAVEIQPSIDAEKVEAPVKKTRKK